MAWKENTLSFSGELLIPGFSIYLMEVTIDGVFDGDETTLSKWYYIGMTGDNYYPSARSAFHRISGHLELSDVSTQNQLYNGIKALVGNRHRERGEFEDKTWEDVKITMTSYPIEGFDDTPWLDRRVDEENFKFNNEHMAGIKAVDENNQFVDTHYRNFKEAQSEVASFEKQLIRYAKGKLNHEEHKSKRGYLFNSGAGNEEVFAAGEYAPIAAQICERMKIDW